jgi:2-oxoglutarate dehydrogenase E1 component
MSGLVMLLPHGYEGQGPEHSSARIERFLQSCADDNLQIANCTTAAQYFHLLRRQMRRTFRAPLVVFTPKSLLRAPRAMSSAAELSRGRFSPVLGDDEAAASAGRIERVILCSGKVYYDLLDERQRRFGDAGNAALVRLEELYPWPAEALSRELCRFPNAGTLVWTQEEPANMGAFTFVRDRLERLGRSDQKLLYAGREESASTATGSMRVHRREQAALVTAAFDAEAQPSPGPVAARPA